MATTASPARWQALAVATVLAVYFAIAMEWLFVLTKPSFMAALTPAQSTAVLLVTPLALAAVALALLGALRLAATVAARAAFALAVALPAVVLACSAFLLVDNFTYTVFQFGVGSTTGRWPAVYALLLAATLAGTWAWLWRATRDARAGAGLRALTRLATALVVTSSVVAAWKYASAGHAIQRGETATVARRPNILIIATDGLDASETSAYGYARRTTPFIDSLLPSALVCENALPNGTVTAASVVSMLTGRLPTETRVFSPKDVLMGAGSYQSLPAILRRLGYTTVALVPGVADPFDRNLRDAFDVANGRSAKSALQIAALPDRVALGFASELYFAQYAWERLESRLAHATLVRRMVNQFREATVPSDVPDEVRIRNLTEFLAGATRPVFAYLHLMGTHGPFVPRQKTFSGTSTQRTDLLDDAVLDFDANVAGIVETLRKYGKLDDTVLVLMSDHGSQVSRHGRVPLVFVFPGGVPHGRVVGDTQLLDIAPSLLDYLGAPVPAWMTGRSLLSAKADLLRPIFTAHVRRDAPGGERLTQLSTTVCNRVYDLDFLEQKVASHALAGHTATCPERDLPDDAHARDLMVSLLERSGFDMKALEQSAHELALVGAKLRGANMASAQLAGQFLTGADLTEATLTGADLTGTSFTGANLTGADLTGATMSKSRFHDANLTRARLADVNLLEARLPNAKFVGADLRRANLTRVVLTGADLSDADLSDADVSEARVNKARLTGAHLPGVKLVRADLTGSNLHGADLTGANLTLITLTSADLSGAVLRGANLSQAVGMTSEQDDLADLDATSICPDGKPAGEDESCVGQGGASSPALGTSPPPSAAVAAKP